MLVTKDKEGESMHGRVMQLFEITKAQLIDSKKPNLGENQKLGVK